MPSSLILHSIKNLTNGLDIHASTPGHHGGLEMVEWKEHTLVFQSGAKAVPGQLVALSGRILVGKHTWPFEATGKVISVAPHIDQMNRFEIALQQFDRSTWKRYVDGLNEEQSRADEIINKIRGED